MKVRLNVVSGPAKGRFFDLDDSQTLERIASEVAEVCAAFPAPGLEALL